MNNELISKLVKASQEIDRKPKANYMHLSKEFIQSKADEKGVTFDEMVKIIEIELYSEYRFDSSLNNQILDKIQKGWSLGDKINENIEKRKTISNE